MNNPLEPQDLLQDDEGLCVDETITEQLSGAGKWSRGIGITMAVCSVIALLGIVLMPNYPLFQFTINGDFPVYILITIGLIMGGSILLHMIQFGNNLEQAFKEKDQIKFEKATTNLKTYMVLTCIVFAFIFIRTLLIHII